MTFIGTDGKDCTNELKPMLENLSMNKIELAYLYALLKFLTWNLLSTKEELLPLLIGSTVIAKVLLKTLR